MIKLSECQSTVVTLLRALSYPDPDDENVTVSPFTGQTIFADDGAQRATIEAALAERGMCIGVDLPSKGTTFQSGVDHMLCEALIPIHIRINPNVNSKLAEPWDAMQIVELICYALDEWSGDDAGFGVAEDIFVIIVADEGLFGVVVWATKIVNI